VHSNTTGSNALAASLIAPAASGSRQARRDIAAGHLRLMEAGTRGAFAPNVPASDARFSRVPRHRLPSGCTDPNATAWIRYAEAYNAVMVAHIQNNAAR
jgi:hypothetical protein